MGSFSVWHWLIFLCIFAFFVPRKIVFLKYSLYLVLIFIVISYLPPFLIRYGLISFVSTIFLAFGAIWIYSRWGVVREKREEIEAEIHELENQISKVLSKGWEYEKATHDVIAKIRKSMSAMAGSWMPGDDGIKDVIVLPSDAGQASQEIDALIVTSFGVFVVEVKGWKGKVYSLNGTFYQGDKVIKSPEVQTMSKLKRLAQITECSEMIPVYVFAHERAELSPDLSSSYLSLGALQHFFMDQRDKFIQSGKNSVPIAEVVEYIKIFLDKEKNAKERHLIRQADLPGEDKADPLLVKNSRNRINDLNKQWLLCEETNRERLFRLKVPVILCIMSLLGFGGVASGMVSPHEISTSSYHSTQATNPASMETQQAKDQPEGKSKNNKKTRVSTKPKHSESSSKHGSKIAINSNPENTLVPGEERVEWDKGIEALEANEENSDTSYQKRPKRKFLSARVQEYRFASYVESWRGKIQAVSDQQHFSVTELGNGAQRLRVTVGILADGSLERVELNQGSGDPSLDASVKQIFELAAPYDKFPEEIARDTDVIELVRTIEISAGGKFKLI